MKPFLFLLSALLSIQCFPGCVSEDTEDPRTDSLMVYSTRDVHVERENKNTGLGSEVRLMDPDALALLAFDTMPAIPAGKHLEKAELVLRGWTDGEEDANVTMDLFATSGDWIEGTGHWYVFSGGTHNGFASVYAEFPEYQAPAGTTDPILSNGLTWSSSEALRAGIEKISTAKAVFPRGVPYGRYPLLEHTGALVFDLTAYLGDDANRDKPLYVGIRQAPAGSGPKERKSWIYSRNHMDPKVYGPKLVLTFR